MARPDVAAMTKITARHFRHHFTRRSRFDGSTRSSIDERHRVVESRFSLAPYGSMLYFRPVPEDFSLEPILTTLERAFRERGMAGHLAKLETFHKGYAAQRQRLAGVQHRPWTSETVIELARVYQVPPFDNDYPVAPNDGRCPNCRADVRTAPTVVVLADRSVCSCRKCSRRFVRVVKT